MKKFHLLLTLVALLFATTSLWALTNNVDNGKLYGAFSVAAGTKVYFSQGNLQYQGSTQTWRFAQEQYHYVGDASEGNVYENNVKCNNASISQSYSGWIDLFGWGTAGWFDGAQGSYMPYATSAGNNYVSYLTSSGQWAPAKSDWGVKNAISNGGNQAGLWRTLSLAEWNYVLGTRTNATSLRGLATIWSADSSTVIARGLILLPDNWKQPNGCTFAATTSNYTTNNYKVNGGWVKMENAGAVFFPAAGMRAGATSTSTHNVVYLTVSTATNYIGNYYSSTAWDKNNAYYLNIVSTGISMTWSVRRAGRSVRLVSTTAPKMPATILSNGSWMPPTVMMIQMYKKSPLPSKENLLVLQLQVLCQR